MSPQSCNRLDRRAVLRLGSLAGLRLPQILRLQHAQAAVKAPAKDVNCIFIFCIGGMSHHDLWDPKPDAPSEVRSQFRSIGTSVDGLQICEHLPLTAKVMHEVALIRSLTHELGNHDTGTRYLLTGQKIFITYGEHDLTGNIIHMVLARVAGAPDGVKGTSLFLVPKFLVNADGSLGARNDVHCLSVERKLGIHARPTCVLAFGQNGGAIGELIGEENRGLEYMFIMMNAARYSVGIEGVGLSERACQTAKASWSATASESHTRSSATASPPSCSCRPGLSFTRAAGKCRFLSCPVITG